MRGLDEVLLKHESISGITTAELAAMLGGYLGRRRGRVHPAIQLVRRPSTPIEDDPYVCPGCHAVAPDRCAPGCIDAEIEDDHRRAIERGDYDRFEDDDEDEQ